MNEKI